MIGPIARHQDGGANWTCIAREGLSILVLIGVTQRRDALSYIG